MNSPDFLQLLFTAAIIGTLTAYLAKGRGRDPTKWFFIGLLCGVFGLIALFLFPVVTQEDEKQQGGKAEGVVLPPVAPAVVEAPLAANRWFYLDAKHERFGPVAEDALQVLFQEEKITSRTYVWCEGMEGWKRLEDLPELLERLQV